MIHTIEMTFIISGAELHLITDQLKKLDAKRQKEIDAFGENPEKKLHRGFTQLSIPGILAVTLYKHKYFPYIDNVYIKITIEPEALCQNKETNRLFCAMKNNIEVLQQKYAAAIYQLFPNAFMAELYYLENEQRYRGLGSLPYLACAKVSRIDYAVNLYSVNKEVTLELAKNSYLNGRKKLKDFDRSNHNIYASTKTNSRVCKLYDKQQCYREKQHVTSDLYEEAEGVIRFEVQIVNPNMDWLLKHNTYFDFVNIHGALPYLNEEIANNVIREEYAHIGFHDWYSDYEHKKIILASGLSKKSKDILLRQISPIISQSRSVLAAQENYITGQYTIAKTQNIVKGTKATFRKHLKEYEQIGLQPLRIPDRICERHRINHIENPFKRVVLQGEEHNIGMENFLPEPIQERYNKVLAEIFCMPEIA